MKALDLFCGAGGASMGLSRAGFDVTGVDLSPQPRYPFRFIQVDALTVPLDGYDLIWASPPCQRFSQQSNCRPELAANYPDLIAPIRDRLTKTGCLYVIENVLGAPLINPVMLCGAMFKLPLYRHRLFEASWPVAVPPHARHTTVCSKSGHWRPGTFVSVAGNCAPIRMAKAAMGIDWMQRSELAEAIPPAYAEHLARQAAILITHA